MDSITVRIPLPITTNEAYKVANVRRKGIMYLSEAGNCYKLEVMLLVDQLAKDVGFDVDVLDYLGWSMELHPRTQNMDVDGGIKLTQDAIAAALGINDRIFLEVSVRKRKSQPKDPHAIITIYKIKERS